jgi:broad specificity phosphatase PhoE
MQNSTIIWLARHGETDRTSAGRFNGRDDIPLNEIGRLNCTQLAGQLVTGSLDAVIASPLSRAVETAQIVAKARALPVSQDARFIEIDYGEWEGLTYQEVQERWPVLFRDWETDPARHAPPGGETGVSVAERATAALAEVVTRGQGQGMLIVAHKTVNRLLLCTLLNLPLRSYRQAIPQPPCALTRLEFGENGRISITLPDEAEPQVVSLLPAFRLK